MPRFAWSLPLSLLALLPSVLSQSCTQSGPVPSDSDECMRGTNPVCANGQCLYEFCDQGAFAEVALNSGDLFDDSPVFFYCHNCPGQGQTTDDQDGYSSGIGECYVPCGPAKCYVPSVGGTNSGAYQIGAGVCVNSAKGICEETCDLEGHIPIPDAYSLNNTCILDVEEIFFLRKRSNSTLYSASELEPTADRPGTLTAANFTSRNPVRPRRYARHDLDKAAVRYARQMEKSKTRRRSASL